MLVCPIPPLVWSGLFPSIGALVTDSGGVLSQVTQPLGKGFVFVVGPASCVPSQAMKC